MRTRDQESSSGRWYWAAHQDVDDAVRSGLEAFEEWSQASLTQRSKVLFAFRELVNASVDELAELVTSEHGKVLSDARGEVLRGLEVIESPAASRICSKATSRTRSPRNVNACSFREPLRVVVGITPFNFPVMVP